MVEIGSWSHIFAQGFSYIYIYIYIQICWVPAENGEPKTDTMLWDLLGHPNCCRICKAIIRGTWFHLRPFTKFYLFKAVGASNWTKSIQLFEVVMFLNHLDLMCSWTIQLFNSPNTSGATTAVTNILLEFCLWCYLHMNMAEDRVTPALTTRRKNDKKNNKRKQHILSTSSNINTNT